MFLGKDNQNLIDNPGFEADVPETSWNNVFVKTDTDPIYKKAFSGSNYGYVDSEHLLSKSIQVEKTGYYDFGAYVSNPNSDAKVEFVKDGRVVRTVDVPKTANDETYARIFIKDLELTKGENIFRFTNSSDTGYQVDEVELQLKAEETIFTNIHDIEFDGRINKQVINREKKTIDLEYVYGDDLSEITVKDMQLSDGVSSSVKKGDQIDLTKPYEMTLTTKDGQTSVWTINAKWYHRKISMTSSNKQLENFFNWAVNKLDDYVVTGQTGKVDDGKKPDAKYSPSYWAGYFNRTAYYSRDFVHQATGGQIGGLADENFNMFKTFAQGTKEEREWYTLWAYNFDGSPYWMDYKSDKFFVKEIPAQFELVEKAWNQYLWSGDERYINDPDLLNYYEKTVNEFVEVHDDVYPNGIAEGKGGLFSGLATYNERKNDFQVSGDPTVEAADGIACQYAAFQAYANILNARGETEKAKEWYDKAKEIKRYFNEEWSVYKADPSVDEFVVELSKNGRQRIGFAMETNYFIPLKELVEPGERNDAALDLILEGLGTGVGFKGAPQNIESYTYIPEMLYKYNRTEEAWKWMKYIDSIKFDKHEMAHQGLNGDYPEVSFTAISNTVEGMMGVAPNAGEHFIATAPRLSKEIPDATVKYMDIGGQLLHLTHVGNTQSELTNVSKEDVQWETRFYGNYKYIVIDGKTYEAKQKDLNGELISYATTSVKPNETVSTYATNEKLVEYDVKVEEVKNGTVTVDKTKATKGTTVTVTATPDKGYQLTNITVDGKAIKGNQFVMDNKSVTVSAVFESSVQVDSSHSSIVNKKQFDVLMKQTINDLIEAVLAGKVDTTVISQETADLLKKAIENNEIISTNLHIDPSIQVSKEVQKQYSDFVNKNFDKTKSDVYLSQYFDINLLLNAEDKNIGNIHELKQEIELSVDLSKDYYIEGRQYYVLRMHNGVIEKIAATLSKEGKLTFKTNQFSTFLLVCEDSKLIDDTSNPDKEKPDDKDSGGVQTEDETRIIDFVMLCGITGLITLIYIYRNKKKYSHKK